MTPKHASLYRRGDQWFCTACGKTWDADDPDVPVCALAPTPLRRPASLTRARADLEARTLRLLREVAAEVPEAARMDILHLLREWGE